MFKRIARMKRMKMMRGVVLIQAVWRGYSVRKGWKMRNYDALNKT